MPDEVILSCVQFALIIAFHYSSLAFRFGLGLLLLIMEGTYPKTRNPLYEKMTQSWVRIFSLAFSMEPHPASVWNLKLEPTRLIAHVLEERSC